MIPQYSMHPFRELFKQHITITDNRNKLPQQPNCPPFLKIPNVVFEVCYEMFTCKQGQKHLHFLIILIAASALFLQFLKLFDKGYILYKHHFSERVLCSDWSDDPVCCDWSTLF